ncbi:MAG TPA: hypothetical protein VGS07_12025 [Thermoanaerobaculia bacterium]|jgi:hypothetical protein|nr:hypothetical protein [Thermoanaerobaculia bacterium]
MPTTMEQTKIDQLPAVTFDQENSVINATVIVSPGVLPSTYRHHVSAISAAGLPGSSWTVNWTLETTCGLVATFKEGGGILIPMPTPGGVDNLVINHDFPPNQRQLTFTNNVLDVNVIRYDFDLIDGEGTKLTKAADIIIDPSIAVVRDPIDG